MDVLHRLAMRFRVVAFEGAENGEGPRHITFICGPVTILWDLSPRGAATFYIFCFACLWSHTRACTLLLAWVWNLGLMLSSVQEDPGRTDTKMGAYRKLHSCISMLIVLQVFQWRRRTGVIPTASATTCRNPRNPPHHSPHYPTIGRAGNFTQFPQQCLLCWQCFISSQCLRCTA